MVLQRQSLHLGIKVQNFPITSRGCSKHLNNLAFSDGVWPLFKSWQSWQSWSTRWKNNINVGTKESSPGFLFLDDWNPITRGSMTTLNDLLRSSPTKIP